MTQDYNHVKALFDKLPADDQERLLDSNGPSATHLPTIEETEGGRTTRWDLFSRLLSDRMIRLDGEVNGAMAAVAQASLQFLDHQDSEAPIRMIINSPGGSVMDGLAIYDTMREIKAPVHTQGYGLMASMGSLLLVAGDKRFAAKNSSIMIHQVAAGTQGKFQDMEVGHENTERLYKQLVDIYVAHTGVDEEFWYDKLLSRDNWLSPEDAMKLNLIDEIIPHTKPAPFEHMINKTGKTRRENFNEQAKKIIEEIYQERIASNPGNDNAAVPSPVKDVAPAKASKRPKNGM